MEFNLVVFFIAIGFVILAAVIAATVAVVSAVSAFIQKNHEDED